MRLWIDNTGLHGAGRCLAGEATLDQQLRGLLQLATLLIFSDSVAYGDYETDQIGEIAEQYRQRLVDLGVDPSWLASRRLSPSECRLAYEQTARLAAEEWPTHFERAMAEGLVTSFDVPVGVSAGQNWIPAFLGGPRVDKPESLLLSRRPTAAVEYMLSQYPFLHAAVAATVRDTPDWGPAATYQLLSFLRTILNDRFAQFVGGTYVPAVSRAEQLRKENSIISADVERQLEGLARQWKPGVASIPSVSRLLLWRARGDPHGVIQEALEMRQQAKWLRKRLGERLGQLRRDPLAASAELDERDFPRSVAAAFGLEEEPRFIDALEIQFIVGLPSLSLNAGKLYDWMQHSLWKRRLIVLTDLARSDHLRQFDQALWKTFRERSMRRSRERP